MKTYDSGLSLMLRHLSEQFFPLGTDKSYDFAMLPDRARVRISDTVKDYLYPQDPHFSSAQAQKLALARAYALAATEEAGIPLPRYGVLTGVRPTKVAIRYLDFFGTPELAAKMLEKDYLVSPIQSRILTELSVKDKLCQAELCKNDMLLYVSIPFCPSRCAYCSFISSSSPRHLDSIGEYLNALTDELTELAAIVKKNKMNVKAVYIGGGTPGILAPHQLELLLRTLTESFSLESSEFTCEIGRPDTVTKEKLETLRSFNVGRISINPQTTNDSVLSAIGRTHSAKDFFKAYELARCFDFDSINCDLIAGLPTETKESFYRSVKEVTALSPENITVHSFCLKRSAKLFDFRFTDSLTAQKMVDFARESCISAGYMPYYLYRQKNSAGAMENTGYSKSGKDCLYNIAMMEDMLPVIACGAGGITKFPSENKDEKIKRIAQFKYHFEYLSMPEKVKNNLKLIDTILNNNSRE